MTPFLGSGPIKITFISRLSLPHQFSFSDEEFKAELCIKINFIIYIQNKTLLGCAYIMEIVYFLDKDSNISFGIHT